MDQVMVPVPRDVIREVIEDGCCPLHLRLQLRRALQGDPIVDIEAALKNCTSPLTTLDPRCLAAVASHLSLASVLSLRTGSSGALQWAMQRPVADEAPLQQVHDRVRARLWMRRVAEVTAGTDDETVFETRLRSYADEALRTRMEAELREALDNSERQIRAFQDEVGRRMEEQEQHTRSLVEAQVQEGLDAILAVEIAKVRAVVEEQVLERVGGALQREIRRAVRDLRVELGIFTARCRGSWRSVAWDLQQQLHELRKLAEAQSILRVDEVALDRPT